MIGQPHDTALLKFAEASARGLSILGIAATLCAIRNGVRLGYYESLDHALLLQTGRLGPEKLFFLQSLRRPSQRALAANRIAQKRDVAMGAVDWYDFGELKPGPDYVPVLRVGRRWFVIPRVLLARRTHVPAHVDEEVAP